MFNTIAIAIGVIIVAVLAYAATRPDSFRVERSASVKAPPEKIFANLQDFSKWPAWSPWKKLDPAMKRSHSGAAAGKGAAYAWESEKVGTGRMEILDAAVASGVKIKLDFSKPFEAHNTAEFSLKPQGDSTLVTWAMYGPSNFMSKTMGIFMSMDAIVGKDFEKGLADLKSVSEK